MNQPQSSQSQNQQSNKTSYLQFSLFGLADETTRHKLFNRLISLTPHPILTYEHNHILTLQYDIQKIIQGVPRTQTINVILHKKSNEPFTKVKWSHDTKNISSHCEVKVIDECMILNGNAHWFLQSLGATIKNEYVECLVSEFRLDSGIEIRVFKLGKCDTPLKIDTIKFIHEEGNIHVVEVRGIAQQGHEKYLDEAMSSIVNELKSIISLSKKND